MQIRKIFACFFIAVAIGGLFRAIAQQSIDPKAKAVLDVVSQKYRSYRTLQASFGYTLDNPKDKVNETQTGVLYIAPSLNKYKIVLGSQEIISDGKATYTYLKEQKEVDINAIDSSAEAINPAKIFTLYQRGFRPVYREETVKSGRKKDVIELIPLRTSKIFKVLLTIDRISKSMDEIKLFDKNGNHYTYTVKALVPNPKLTSTFFSFDKSHYPGVEVVDLR